MILSAGVLCAGCDVRRGLSSCIPATIAAATQQPAVTRVPGPAALHGCPTAHALPAAPRQPCSAGRQRNGPAPCLCAASKRLCSAGGVALTSEPHPASGLKPCLPVWPVGCCASAPVLPGHLLSKPVAAATAVCNGSQSSSSQMPAVQMRILQRPEPSVSTAEAPPTELPSSNTEPSESAALPALSTPQPSAPELPPQDLLSHPVATEADYASDADTQQHSIVPPSSHAGRAPCVALYIVHAEPGLHALESQNSIHLSAEQCPCHSCTGSSASAYC